MEFRYFLVLITILMSFGVHAAEEVKKPVEPEDPVEQLFRDSECYFCHYDGYQIIGPALIEISLKYQNDKEASTKLAKIIRDGSIDTWGPLPMPATAPEISDETIQTLSKWILAKKDNPKVGEVLYEHNSCFTCHADEGKNGVGPSLVEIAAKYKGDKTAHKKLVKKVREGGTGVWGTQNMPATAVNVSDASIGLITTWMLQFKPKPKEAKIAP